MEKWKKNSLFSRRFHTQAPRHAAQHWRVCVRFPELVAHKRVARSSRFARAVRVSRVHRWRHRRQVVAAAASRHFDFDCVFREWELRKRSGEKRAALSLYSF